jgi:hypothetical protein
MNPKEKARELFEKMRLTSHPILTQPSKDKMAKKCALIAVEEAKTACTYGEALPWVPEEQGLQFWNEVQQEIEKL